MSEEYLLAWSEHHATFFSAMSELVSGDVLTDVSVWAGQTMYSAHRLVLALSSSYFRFAVTGAAQEGRYPVIFLKDVSSRDFERLLAYMYHGEVSVPQSELLSLISAAKSLGVRGLAEEGGGLAAPREEEREGERERGVKREGEKEVGAREPPQLVKKPKLTSTSSQPPRLQQKSGQKIWTKRESGSSGGSTGSNKEEKEEEPAPPAAVKPQKENVATEEEEEQRLSDKGRKEGKEKVKEKAGEKVEKPREDETRAASPPGKHFAPFFEVNVKQEEEDEDETGSDPAEPDYPSLPGLSLVRRALLPPSLLPPSVRLLAAPQQQATIQRNTGTCHFCGRSFMKNKQLMNHVCPMRPSGK